MNGPMFSNVLVISAFSPYTFPVQAPIFSRQVQSSRKKKRDESFCCPNLDVFFESGGLLFALDV
jgi:hypothetical protein